MAMARGCKVRTGSWSQSGGSEHAGPRIACSFAPIQMSAFASCSPEVLATLCWRAGGSVNDGPNRPRSASLPKPGQSDQHLDFVHGFLEKPTTSFPHRQHGAISRQIGQHSADFGQHKFKSAQAMWHIRANGARIWLKRRGTGHRSGNSQRNRPGPAKATPNWQNQVVNQPKSANTSPQRTISANSAQSWPSSAR